MNKLNPSTTPKPPGPGRMGRALANVRNNADTGTLTATAVVAWAAAEYAGVQLPPGISELVAGWAVMLATRIKNRITS